MGHNYKEYLQSEHWKEVKLRCRKAKSFKTCICCKSSTYDIHHLTYKNIGRENLRKDLVPLCRAHHYAFHDWEKLQSDFSINDVRQWIKENNFKVSSIYNDIKIKRQSTEEKERRSERFRLQNINNLIDDYKRLFNKSEEFIKITPQLAKRIIFAAKFCKCDNKSFGSISSKKDILDYFYACLSKYFQSRGESLPDDIRIK